MLTDARSSELIALEHLLRQAVHDGVAPAIAFGVGVGDAPLRCWYEGRETPEADAARVDAQTQFDLASLTKPLCTTLWCLRLVEAGRLELSTPIGDVVPLANAALGRTPVWRLMSHTSGLPAHREYFRGLLPFTRRSGDFDGARRALRRMLASTELERPTGAGEVYSDLGYLLLEMVCEAVDAPLSARWTTLPGHGPDALHFRASGARADAEGYAATELCPLRETLVKGEVHDENAWVMGGLAGHAGLFGTLDAVLSLGIALGETYRGRASLPGISTELLGHAFAARWMHPQGTRVLGFDTPTPGQSSAGSRFGRRTIGHLGFTGTSIWLDLERAVVMVLLTNRVCPTRQNIAIRAFRPRVHDAAWALLDAELPRDH